MGSKKGLILLENNRLSFILHKKEPIILDIPLTLSENLEVKNETELQNLFKSFFENNEFKRNEWIIVLSPKITFEKALYGPGVEKSANPLDEFLALIPMEREKIGFKIGQKDSKIFAWATSSNYLQAIYGALKNSSITIVAIVPALAFGDDLAAIYNSKDIQKYNFLDTISNSSWSLTTFLKNLYSDINMKNKGFTLIELLLVIGIIALLAVVVFVALNPTKRFSDTRDSRRATDVETILTAIHSYINDNKGALPTGLTTGMSIKQLGTATSGCSIVGCGVAATGDCVDLSTPMAKYLKSMPIDPNSTASAGLTQYAVQVDSNGIVTVKACSAESGPVSASR